MGLSFQVLRLAASTLVVAFHRVIVCGEQSRGSELVQEELGEFWEGVINAANGKPRYLSMPAQTNLLGRSGAFTSV
jgi:hypothetical protein